jgi:hypothetical protein
MFLMLAAALTMTTCDLTKVHIGMSRSFVTSLCGQPTGQVTIHGVTKFVYQNTGSAGYDIIWFNDAGVRNSMHTMPDATH